MRTNPEVLAWRVLLAAFALFVVIVGSATYAAYWYVFRSTVPMAVDLLPARGTVGLVPPNAEQPIAATGRRANLEAETLLRTDANSQASVLFKDPTTGASVASLTIFRDSEVRLRSHEAPRFQLNQADYELAFEVIFGEAELVLFEESQRGFGVSALTTSAAAMIELPGSYSFEVIDDVTQVTVREGSALITRADNNRPARLWADQRIAVALDEPQSLVVRVPSSIIQDPRFQQPLEDIWLFYNDRRPPGEAEVSVFDGRHVVTIDRSTERYPGVVLDHGETGLVQNVEVDVSGETFLALRTTFFVEEQSLSTCGALGSECPMMVRFVYLDSEGFERVFIHGFYALHDPGLNFPLACASCRSDHERINLNSWYTYDSGNLMTILPAAQRPQTILQVSFYASGHAYKIHIAEVDLRASSE